MVGDNSPYYNIKLQVRQLQSLLNKLPDPTTPRRTRDQRPRPHFARQLSQDQIKQLAAAYRAGATVSQLGEQFGINRRTVSALLQRVGISPRYRRLSPAQITQAVRLYEAGWSLARIGDRFDTTASTVRARLLERGGIRRGGNDSYDADI